MDEDFYIKFLGASRYEDEGRIHYRMLEPRERVDALLPLLRELIQSGMHPDENHICPTCGMTLEISFDRYKGEDADLTVGTYCKTCNITVVFKSNKIPLWAPAPKSFFEALDEIGKRGDKNA